MNAEVLHLDEERISTVAELEAALDAQRTARLDALSRQIQVLRGARILCIVILFAALIAGAFVFETGQGRAAMTLIILCVLGAPGLGIWASGRILAVQRMLAAQKNSSELILSMLNR